MKIPGSKARRRREREIASRAGAGNNLVQWRERVGEPPGSQATCHGDPVEVVAVDQASREVLVNFLEGEYTTPRWVPALQVAVRRG